jgi:gallate dioxygenase
VGEEWRVADEGGGLRQLPPVKGHAALAKHIGQSLVTHEFDLSFFQNKGLGGIQPIRRTSRGCRR